MNVQELIEKSDYDVFPVFQALARKTGNKRVIAEVDRAIENVYFADTFLYKNVCVEDELCH